MKNRARPAFLALSCIGASFASSAVAAQTTSDQQSAPALGTVTVSDTAIDERPGSQQASPKATRSVRDTPQTVTVVSSEEIKERNLLSLQDILSTVPGITFGAGEGGSGFGDKITLRGYAADTDITVDGVTDSAQYTRSDPFNLEQVEVTSGANSSVAGSGSIGGSINLVTKKPKPENDSIVTGAIGTRDYYRGTVDMNRRVSDLVAVRLNAMVHKNDIPGRDVENNKRWGIAPAVTIGIDSPTRLTLQYFHQEDDNIPEYGVPYYQTDTVSATVPGVDRSSYYGYRNVDRQRDNVDQLTATFEHEFSDRVSIRNLTRWQDVRQFTRVDPPQGTYCLDSGETPTGSTCDFPGYYQPSGPRGTTRKSDNQLAYDQVDLRAVADTGGIEHTIDLGASARWEKYDLISGNSLRNADGSAAFSPYPLISIDDPNSVIDGGDAAYVYGSNVYTGPVNFIPTARQQGEQQNYAFYLFDTMKLTRHFEFNASVRYDHILSWHRSDKLTSATSTSGGVYTRGDTFHNDDNLFSYRVGLVYKPIEAVSLYAAYGVSKTPSQTSVNGSCSADDCDVKPESARTYEIGAKAELFNGGLLLTAAAFRNELNQFKVDSGDPTVPAQQLDGDSRVNGIALGATGHITPAWSISANYTYLDSEILRGIAKNSPAGTEDVLRGTPLPNTPKNSGSLFTTYTLPFGLSIGYGLTYQEGFYLSSRNAPAVTKTDSYVVHDAYLAYTVNDALTLQLNVKNFTDKLYYTRVRNNGWATPGDGRSAVLSASYRF